MAIRKLAYAAAVTIAATLPIVSARAAPRTVINAFVADGGNDTRPCGFVQTLNGLWRAIPFSHVQFNFEMAALFTAKWSYAQYLNGTVPWTDYNRVNWTDGNPVAECDGIIELYDLTP